MVKIYLRIVRRLMAGLLCPPNKFLLIYIFSIWTNAKCNLGKCTLGKYNLQLGKNTLASDYKETNAFVPTNAQPANVLLIYKYIL